MLGLMLASGAEAASCGEASSWFRVARYRSGASVPEEFKPLRNVDERFFHRKLMEHNNVRFAVDSSKDIDWVIDHTRWAPETELRVFNILIWKSPVDIAFSWWKRGNYDRWRSYYLRYHYQLLHSGLDFYTVNYDTLVNDPSGTLQSLCALTGLPYFEGKEFFWRYSHTLMGTNSTGVRNQLRMRTSEFKKPTITKEFAPLARNIAGSSVKDRRLQRMLEALRQRDASSASVPPNPVPHQYAPNALSFLIYRLYRALKLPWIRFRWNVIEPYFGPFGAVS